MIPFNKPLKINNEIGFIEDVVNNRHLSGDGIYTKKCHTLLHDKFGYQKVQLTTSGTDALEMTALLMGIEPGDEVIMPSYTFVSTANAFVLRGATIKFVDIRKDTMNIDENLIENAITDKTKAIIPVHYAGVACEMNKINSLAKDNKLFVVEDAAQGLMSKYHGKYLGSLGDFSCFSFHETKNYTMGEGGALAVNNKQYNDMADIIWHKGTNRTAFVMGEVDKYTWVNVGSSFLPSELNAAYLYGSLLSLDDINNKRLALWNHYFNLLKELSNKEHIELPHVPPECEHNAHMFYIKVENYDVRAKLIDYLKSHGISAVFHYIPLHSSPAGLKHGEFVGQDIYTTVESNRLLRLPIYYDLKLHEVENIASCIEEFFKKV